MNKVSLKKAPITKLKYSKKNDQKVLKEYLEYVEKNKLHYIISIIEEANPEISVSNLEYIYGVTKIYSHSENTISNLSILDFLKFSPVIIQALFINPIEVFSELLSSLDVREMDIISSRYKLSLETLGTKHNITRERVRQIEFEVFSKFSKVLGDLFIHYGNKEGFLNLDVLVDYLSEDELKILNYLYDVHDLFIPDEVSGKIIIKTQNYTKFIANTKELINYDMLTTDDINNFIEEQKELEIYHLEIEDIVAYLSVKNFKNVDNTLVNMRLICTPYLYIIENYFSDGIELKQKTATNDYLKMIELGNKLFGLERRDNNVRNLMARLRENLVAINRSVYKLTKNFNYDVILIDQILQELNESKERNVFYFSEIYEMYKEVLHKTGIKNRYSLASTINRTPFKENTDRDKITFSGEKSISFYDMLNSYVLDSKTVVTTNDIRSKFPFIPTEMIHQNLIANKKIIDWGHARYIHENNAPCSSAFNTKEIDNYFQENKIMVYRDFVRKFVGEKDLRKFGLHLEADINNLFELIFPQKYLYREGFIWSYDTKDFNVVQRLFIYLNKTEKDEISIDEIKNFASNNNLNYEISRQLIRSLDKNFIRKNYKEYYSYDTTIADDDLKELMIEIKRLINNKTFVTTTMVFEECYLPTKNFYWSHETLVNIVRNNMSKEINFHAIGVDKLLTTYGLFSTKQIDSLVDLVFNYFKQIGMTKVSAIELEKFMLEKDISNIGIPPEFYKSENYPFVNEYFILTET